MKKAYRVAPDVKEQIIKRIKDDGVSVAAAAKEHGVSEATIYGWLGSKVKGVPSMLEYLKLKRENDELLRLGCREIYSNLLDLACRARALYEKKNPEQRRRMLHQLFSNLTLKDKKLTHVFVEPLEKLATRVQMRIDAKRNLERQKTLHSKAKSTFDFKNDPLLPSVRKFRTAPWADIQRELGLLGFI